MRVFVEYVSDHWLSVAQSLPRPMFLNLWSAYRSRLRLLMQPGDTVLFVHRDSPRQVHGFAMIHRHLFGKLVRTWNQFGRNNGVSSLERMRAEAGLNPAIHEQLDTVVHNTILINPVFNAAQALFELSPRFFRAASATGLSGQDAHQLVLHLRLHAAEVDVVVAERSQDPFAKSEAVNHAPDIQPYAPIVEAETWSAYHHRCAVTNWRADVALRIVMIRPLEMGGVPEVSNAMLLRSELADLYRAFLIAFTENGKLVMHVELARIDPVAYAQLGRLSLRNLRDTRNRPDPASVAWRLNGRFGQRAF